MTRLAVIALAILVFGGTAWAWTGYRDDVQTATDPRPAGQVPSQSIEAEPEGEKSVGTVAQSASFEDSASPLPDLKRGGSWETDFAPPATADSLRSDGGLVLESPGASYLWTVNDSASQAVLEFSFRPGKSTGAGVNLSFSKITGPNAYGEGGVFTNSIHTTLTPKRFDMGAFNDAGNLRSLRSGPLDLEPGERYKLKITRTGQDTLEFSVVGQTGTMFVQDPSIGDLWGGVVGIEHFQPVGDYETDALPALHSYKVWSQTD